MCDPISIAVAGFAVGSKVISHVGENRQRKEARKESGKAFELTVSDIEARRAEERALASGKFRDIRDLGISSASTAQLSAVEAGVKGGTIDLLIGDIARQEGQARTSVKQNLAITERQLDRSERQAGAQLEGRLRQFKGKSVLPLIANVGAGIFGSITSNIVANDPSFRSNPSFQGG